MAFQAKAGVECTDETSLFTAVVVQMNLQISVSPGELLDRITILEIKRDRTRCGERRMHTNRELQELRGIRDQWIPRECDPLEAQLREFNEQLWDLENQLRNCETEKQFDGYFIDLARNVYLLNDQRAEIKQSINDLLCAKAFDQKEYSREQRSAAVTNYGLPCEYS